MVNFIETFCCRNGEYLDLEYHRVRVLRTLHSQTVWEEILGCLYRMDRQDWHNAGAEMRCTVEYNAAGVSGWRAVKYEKRDIRRLVPVVSDIDYHMKYADRSGLDRLKSLVGDGEEPLIVQKGFVTDTTFANVVFQRHDGKLVTPRKPLLEGTKRARLLAEGIIYEQDITPYELVEFRKFYLINAMRDIDGL